MKFIKWLTLACIFIAAGFAGGYIYYSKLPQAPAAQQRRILDSVDPMPPASPPMAAGAFHVSADKQQLIGVKYDTVQLSENSQNIRAVGKIAQDETRIAHVHTRVEGWVDKVYVDFVGKFVSKGDPLLTIYSPEMLATQEEFLLALKARETMKSSREPEVSDQMDRLVASARRRLELWDLSAAQIDRLEESRTPMKTITVYSPATGYVTERNALPNAKIDPAEALYTIVDLSRVWIIADVFEYEMKAIGPGTAVIVSLPYSPDRAFSAHVTFVQPQVDPMTRTLKVRMEAANPGLLLKPDMAVDVKFQFKSGAMITIPSEALLDSGERKTVFVDLGAGYLEPRNVDIGRRIGDRIEIVKGLQPGERIVSSGTFLIDSESRLRAAGAAHQHGAPAEKQAPPAPAEHKHD